MRSLGQLDAAIMNQLKCRNTVMPANRKRRNVPPCIFKRRGVHHGWEEDYCCRRARSLQPHITLFALGREEQSHRHHRRIVKSMPAEKILRTDFGTVGEQRDAKEVFLAGKVDRILQELRSVALVLVIFVDDQILQQNDEAPFRRY